MFVFVLYTTHAHRLVLRVMREGKKTQTRKKKKREREAATLSYDQSILH